jgi:hypothetical protein
MVDKRYLKISTNIFFSFIMKRVPQYTNTLLVGDLQDAVLACATPHSFERGLAEVSGTTA